MHRLRQRGSIMVLAAGIILTLTSFAVLGFDIGRLMIVRNELQNVADAAALAGANCLPRLVDPASTVNCLATPTATIQWARASAKAQDTLSRNAAANTAISSTDGGHQIEVGYWNLATQTPTGGSFSTTITPGVNDKPAVRVTVRKDAGMNNGPVVMLSRLIYGNTTDVPIAARAVAVISSPGSVAPGSGVLPMVINKCMFDLYWNSSTGTPRIYNGPGSTPVDPYSLSTVGQPYEIRIGSSYHYPGCAEVGQWTTFTLNSSSASTVRDLITGGTPASIAIGDQTWIKPGTVSADYQTVRATYLGKDVTVVVVDAPDGSLSSQGPQLVYAFAGFHIDAVQPTGAGGTGFYIQGHFIPATVTSASSGVGPFYGTYTPSRLGF